jgi:hypothetical protein
MIKCVAAVLFKAFSGTTTLCMTTFSITTLRKMTLFAMLKMILYRHERDCCSIVNDLDGMRWNRMRNDIRRKTFMNSKLELVILFLTVMNDISRSLLVITAPSL